MLERLFLPKARFVMNDKRRVAITGIGVVSPLGNDAQSTWQNLLQGQSGIASIKNFDASGFPTSIAAEVKSFEFNSNKFGKIAKYTVPFTQFALEAADQAFEDAKIRPTESNAERWGIVTGSGMMTAEYSYWQKFVPEFAQDGSIDWDAINTHGASFFNQSDFGKIQSNCGLGLLSKFYNIRGYSNSVHTACASGGQALGLALQAIRRNDADFMLAGGFDSMINPVGLSSFCLLGALSTLNEAPHSASRPFDYQRNGFVLGEGAAFLILESFEHATSRGATIYAELAGEGNSLSSYRITDSHPSGDGAKQAIEQALVDAALEPQDLDYINAHGTSTKMNDLSETNAIKSALPDRAYQVPVSSTKSMTGHLIAAAGALEAAITALAIHNERVPMTANLEHPDPECDLDYVTTGVRQQTIRAALSNSFGFGGSNSCLAFKHPEFEGGAR